MHHRRRKERDELEGGREGGREGERVSGEHYIKKEKSGSRESLLTRTDGWTDDRFCSVAAAAM